MIKILSICTTLLSTLLSSSWLSLLFLLIYSFIIFYQMRVTFRLAFRRSFSSSYNCDQSIISSGSLLGSGDSWRTQCVDYYGYDSQCNGRNIADTGFRCTDYSSVEDWSMGENNFTYDFPSLHDKWLVRYAILLAFLNTGPLIKC